MKLRQAIHTMSVIISLVMFLLGFYKMFHSHFDEAACYFVLSMTVKGLV